MSLKQSPIERKSKLLKKPPYHTSMLNKCNDHHHRETSMVRILCSGMFLRRCHRCSPVKISKHTFQIEIILNTKLF